MYKIFLICILLQTILAQYNNSIGLKYLHFAKATYCEKQDILDWNCEACIYNDNVVHRFVIENTKFQSLSFVGLNRKDKEIVVAFRGSNNIRNWMTNLNFLKTSYESCDKCKIHKGFYNAWVGQKEAITNRVKLLLEANPGFKVSIVGHSLGGAIATICAVELRQQGIRIDNLLTYGAPRIGNQEYVDYVKKMVPNATRIVRRKDPVPHVPPRTMGFSNFGTEHFYNSDDDLEYETCHIFEKKSCSNQYLPISTVLSVSDHTNYLGRNVQCSEKLEMGFEQYDQFVLKTSENEDEQYKNFEDFVQEQIEKSVQSDVLVDLNDETAMYEWVIKVDDNDIDYLIMID